MTTPHAIEHRRRILSTGRECRLESARAPFLKDYFVLAFDTVQGDPTEEEEAELLSLALGEARCLAKEKLLDPGAFVIIHSGRANRRVIHWHAHILLVSNRWQKAWLYFVLWGKNVLQAFGLRKDARTRRVG